MRHGHEVSLLAQLVHQYKNYIFPYRFRQTFDEVHRVVCPDFFRIG